MISMTVTKTCLLPVIRLGDTRLSTTRARLRVRFARRKCRSLRLFATALSEMMPSGLSLSTASLAMAESKCCFNSVETAQ